MNANEARKYELLLVPSDSFGCSGYVRISYCVDTDMINRSLSAFEKLLRRHKLAKPLKTRIVPQNISVEERMRSLSQQLKYKKRVSFVSLFERFDKEYIVVTFLALLELVKGNQMSISQQNYYEDIYISSLEGDEVV